MRDRLAILVSPGAIDAYPPVQNQARLLSDAGYRVEVVTTALLGQSVVAFAHPGVHLHVVGRGSIPGLRAALRVAEFRNRITRLRRQNRDADVVEIAYDPQGVWLSDLAGYRPRVRVAHFHETVEYVDQYWVFSRLRAAVRDYQLVVTPDPLRAEHVRETLCLGELPMVVPNYPLLPSGTSIGGPQKSERFEVVYAGALGRDQLIPFIANSVEAWPAGAELVLLGNDNSPSAREVRPALDKPRIRFEGWLPYEKMVERLACGWLGISLLSPDKLVWRTSLGASNKRYIYMEAALPQIGDMNPGVRELLEGSGVGACLSSFSVDELAAKVSAYEADRDRCLAEGRTARRMFLDTYNYQNAMRPLLDWLDQAGGSSKALLSLAEADECPP